MMTEDGTTRARRHTWIILVLVTSTLAGGAGAPIRTSAPAGSGPYDFDRPDTVFTMPRRLNELSGITVLSDSLLAGVEDENGRLYVISMRTGNVLEQLRFGDDADYEDIENRRDTLWVLDSDGDLYRIREADDGDLESRRFETTLTAAFDTEGLATDPVSGDLWIVAKEYPGPGHDGKRAVYSHDPASGRTSEHPVMLLDILSIEKSRRPEHPVNKLLRRLVSPAYDLERFRPSALEFLPGGDELLVVSSTDPVVVRVSRSGDILSTHTLPRVLRQPEGLAVTESGDLYVASEAAGGRARIAVYRRRAR